MTTRTGADDHIAREERAFVLEHEDEVVARVPGRIDRTHDRIADR